MQTSDDLLLEIIKASNRTTRAVRAFVLFLFIQLTFTTAALFLWNSGNQIDPSQCYEEGICEPDGVTLWLAVIVWIIGVISSSLAGWTELSKSNIPSLPSVSPSKTEFDPERLERLTKKAPSGIRSSLTCKHCGAALSAGFACDACDNRV